MKPFLLNNHQLYLIHAPIQEKIFLEGPFGCGKTTTAIERLIYLLDQKIPTHQILILLPHLKLAKPYYKALSEPNTYSQGKVFITSIAHLARKMIKLFQPLLIEEAKVLDYRQPLTFLNYESAQFYMSLIVNPLLRQGYFASVIMEKNRLYTQILDTLNKAAEMGFPHTEIGKRLISAAAGEKSQQKVYEDVQECASRFRSFCMEHNLLDFSRQLEIFFHILYPHPRFRQFFFSTYRHIFMDNIEEDVPLTHDLAKEWVQEMDSAFIVYEQDGGFRQFLGSDPIGSYTLKNYCSTQAIFNTSYISTEALQNFSIYLSNAIQQKRMPISKKTSKQIITKSEPAFEFLSAQYYPHMLDQVVDEVKRLIDQYNVPPKEIAILTPYLSDSLSYSLLKRFEKANIPAAPQRPSTSLYQDSSIQSLITLVALGNPGLEILPTRNEIAQAFHHSIEGLDIIRSVLLTQNVYFEKNGSFRLLPFNELKPPILKRIPEILLKRYEKIRLWLLENQQSDFVYLDMYIYRLFGDLLSHPGYKFHTDLHAAKMTADLIKSYQNFRISTLEFFSNDPTQMSKEYCKILKDGILSAYYPMFEDDLIEMNAVLISPASTFLINHQPVLYQFWLDIGSFGWSERPYQPLTHTYVLHRNWEMGRVWTEKDEVENMRVQLDKICKGLINRCKKQIFVSFCEIDNSGRENKSPLLKAFDRLLKDSILFGT